MKNTLVSASHMNLFNRPQAMGFTFRFKIKKQEFQFTCPLQKGSS